MYESLKFILDCEDPNLESLLYQPFTIEEEVFGETKVHELVDDGAEIFVNQENKWLYVHELVDYVFNKSIETQFEYFQKGFDAACSGHGIFLFTPSELEGLICGSRILDFEAMKGDTYYEGYEENDEIISWFWEIALAFSEEQKKRFLMFCTGCD